ncbi:MAG: hypothetical protein ACT6U0_07245, partial [Shinella sp.]
LMAHAVHVEGIETDMARHCGLQRLEDAVRPPVPAENSALDGQIQEFYLLYVLTLEMAFLFVG